MTGNLFIKNNSVDRDSPNNDITSTSEKNLTFVDKNGHVIARFNARAEVNGNTAAMIETHQNGKWNTFSIGSNNNGDRLYGVSDPAAFRQSINAAPKIEITAYRVFNNTSISANGYLLIENQSITHAGYSPAGIIGFFSNHRQCVPARCYFNNGLTVLVQNTSAQVFSDFVFDVYVLWTIN